MNQTVAWHWPDDLNGRFCMIRLGIIATRPRALPYALRFRKAIDRSAEEAMQNQAGLLKSERILLSWNHFGYLQYWRDLESLLAWTRSEPHTEWWKTALQRQRQKGDFSIYHETYVSTAKGFEAIYLGLGDYRPGASVFGQLQPPKGHMASARGRMEGPQAGELTGQPAPPMQKPC